MSPPRYSPLALMASTVAGGPYYQVLVHPGAHSVHGTSYGYGYPVAAPSYSYGWFGAHGYTHPVWHENYYGNTYGWWW